MRTFVSLLVPWLLISLGPIACGDDSNDSNESSAGASNAGNTGDDSQGGANGGDNTNGDDAGTDATNGGNGSVDGNTGGAPATNSCEDMGETACGTCQQDSCGDELVACYGEGFTGGDFSGDCADLGGCSVDNDCCVNPTACGTMCLPFFTADCSDCLTALSDCLTAACGTECDTGGVDIPPGGDPTGTCADLADCCAALPDPAGAACDPIVAANQGELCTATLEAFQMGGQCP